MSKMKNPSDGQTGAKPSSKTSPKAASLTASDEILAELKTIKAELALLKEKTAQIDAKATPTYPYPYLVWCQTCMVYTNAFPHHFHYRYWYSYPTGYFQPSIQITASTPYWNTTTANSTAVSTINWQSGVWLSEGSTGDDSTSTSAETN